MPDPRLVAPATAVPAQVLRQCAVAERARHLFVTFHVGKASKSDVVAGARTIRRHPPPFDRRVAQKYCDCEFSKWRRHWPTKEGPR
jgi:hypothetical protein